MKITVTLLCRHPDGFSDHVNITGEHVVISRTGIILDGLPIVWRDRRAKKNREAGHPWVSSPRDKSWADRPNHQQQFEAWTHLAVTIETRS